MKTWQAELLVVTSVLVIVVIAAGGGHVELIGAGAVALSFAHAQVADRLAEGERDRAAYVRDEIADRITVPCHRWARRYLVSKEALWCTYFVLHQSWSALAGAGMFLVYPVWRAWWRRR